MGEHGLGNPVESLLIEAALLLGVLQFGTATQYLLHIFNAFGLFLYDVAGNVLYWDAGCIAQDVVRHFNSCPVVRDHLHNKIVRKAVCQFYICHFYNHIVKYLIKSAEIVLCYVADSLLAEHRFNLLETEC